MAVIQPASAIEQLDAPRAAVVAMRLADLMGLLAHQPGTPIGPDTLRRLAAAGGRVGIAEHIAAGEQIDPHRLLEALEASPLPEQEARRLAAIFGYPRLAELSGASEPSLRRYAAGERMPPDPVAQRLHFLTLLTAILRGSFNEFGIRRWFDRPRRALDERAPGELLRGGWEPDDDGPQATARLAVTLLA
ncbi:MAG: hypothetical protein GEU75_17685 [Dehalococcoidia bacterium]|nr:hypothetical protein [Dehalococcoidia bacterium]